MKLNDLQWCNDARNHSYFTTLLCFNWLVQNISSWTCELCGLFVNSNPWTHLRIQLFFFISSKWQRGSLKYSQLFCYCMNQNVNVNKFMFPSRLLTGSPHVVCIPYWIRALGYCVDSSGIGTVTREPGSPPLRQPVILRVFSISSEQLFPFRCLSQEDRSPADASISQPFTFNPSAGPEMPLPCMHCIHTASTLHAPWAESLSPLTRRHRVP